MTDSKSLTTMAITFACIGLTLSLFGLTFALLGGSGYTGHVTIKRIIPTRVAATPEEVQENWEKLVETINLARDMQKFANAATDPVEKERLQSLADELQKQAEILSKWLDDMVAAGVRATEGQ